MSDKTGDSKSSQSLVHIDGAALAEPARLLVEKVSDAVGGLFRPWQMRRVGAADADVKRMNADAEADASRTASLAALQIDSLQRRALQRLAAEEAAKQQNIENITAAALPKLAENAQPQNIERDWLVNFFDKSRLTSDEEMQGLWAKILAGEANAPGKFSKRTINLMASLDKADAEAFQALCRFVWSGLIKKQPLIFDTQAPVYSSAGLDFSRVQHLADIGLVTFEPVAGFSISRKEAPKTQDWFFRLILCAYADRQLAILPAREGMLSVGSAMFTRAGEDLSTVCPVPPVDGFFEYCVEQWTRLGAKTKEFRVGEKILPADFGL